MKINIKATGIELTPAISEYTSKKVLSIEKYLEKNSADVVAQVEVGKESQHHKSGEVFRAEIHLIGGGVDLYAKSEQADLYAAVDIVKDEIVHNIVQSKGKRETVTRRSAQIMKDVLKGLTDGFNRFKKR